MGRLTDIGLRLGTDKAEHHEFTEFYEDYFSPFLAPKILEIGILDGASLRMYHEYFNGKATIFGVDMNDKSSFFNNHPTIKTIQGDILLSSTMERCKKAVPNGKYDIIIDDGGHKMEEQQKALLGLWDALEDGGIFIIEDLHTSGILDFNPDRTTSTLQMLQGLQNNEYLDSRYITVDQLKKINDEIKDILIWDNSAPQVGPQAGRASITSVIFKKRAEDKQLALGEEKAETVSTETKNEETKPVAETKAFEGPSTVTKEEQKEVQNPVSLDNSESKTASPEKLDVVPIVTTVKKAVLDEFFEFVKKSGKYAKMINIASLDDAMNEFTAEQYNSQK